MDYSEPVAATSYDTPTGQARHGAVRAMLSAAIFGTLGAMVGRVIGKYGNDPQSKLAQPIMQWSMGIFCATLGAYSSFKASEQNAPENSPNVHAELNNAPNVPPANKPLTSAHAKASQHEGRVQQTTRHVALEK